MSDNHNFIKVKEFNDSNNDYYALLYHDIFNVVYEDMLIIVIIMKVYVEYIDYMIN